MAGKRKPLGEDAENIDPKFMTLKGSSSSKRKRCEADDNENEDNENQDPVTPDAKKAVKPVKASRFAIKTIASAPASAPRILNTQPKQQPVTSPTKPAGRSPQASPSKSTCKPFARRSNVSKTRPEVAGRKGVSRPFSIAAALSGKAEKSEKTEKTAAPAPKKETPASWSFDIHVDSEEEEMTNLMQHSTGVLDISDGTTTRRRASSMRGKENVPPSELGLSLPSASPPPAAAAAAAAAATSRDPDMMEESRAPLGELNAADYYGADCHAFSYAVVYEDENEQDAEHMSKPALLPRARPVRHSKLSSVSSLREATVPEPEPVPEADATAGKDIDIWEE